MTSISQSVLPPQPSNTASQAIAPAHSPSSSGSGRAAPQAAGTASATAKPSYAGATKKTSGGSTPAAATSGPQHGKSDVASSVNGKTAIPPAVPTVNTSTLVNGNTPTSSTSGPGEHSRKPSVTISAAGTSGYMPNGGPVAGKPKGGSNIVFGAVPEGSPQMANATPQMNQSTSSLAVNTPSNPRITSPQTSPSPIPQPPASGGGRPPSSLHGNSNSVSFGNFGSPEGNVRPPGAPQGPLAPGPQPSHLRRESSQSQHSDMSNHGIGPAAGRGGYPSQSGRGRNSFQGSYPQQAGYFPGNNARPPPNQPRSGSNMTPFQGQNRNLAPFPTNSPHQAARSPALANAQPVHPQPGQVPMASPQINQAPYGYPNPYGGYPQSMGPPQVNPKSSSFKKYPNSKVPTADRVVLSNPNVQQTIDLSPASGNFDQFLTSRNQGLYGVPQYDPNFQYYPQYNNGMHSGMLPPNSPRPPNSMTPGPHQPPYHLGQYNNQSQPSPMSRTSSAISHTDRPNSSMGNAQPGNVTPAINNAAVASRPTAQSPAPKPPNAFQIPQKKKNNGLIIKDPNTGDVVVFDKTAPSPAPSNKSQTPAVASTPTPPPRTASHNETQHSRAESKSVKTDEEKRNEMREAITKKMEADKEADRRKADDKSKAAQDKKDAEDKLAQEKIDADNRQREAAEAQMKAEESLKKNKAEAEAIEKAALKAKEDADAAAEKARKEQEDEDEIARMEAEIAEQERLREEKEAQFLAKRQAEKEESARREAEAANMADEEMKRAEAEAEAREEARLKEREENEGDESQREREDMFAALKKERAPTPSSETTPAEETPAASGIATPASDTPVAVAPSKGSSKQKPAALKLETSKPIEPAQPTPQLLALRSARPLLSINDVSYPTTISSPNPSLNTTAPMGKFRYDRKFLMQFEGAFKEKPSENWDARLKETVGDTTEPSSARATPSARSAGGAAMTSGRQPSNRAPMPAMGAFAQGGRTLPPGTSSQQRFEASSRAQGIPPARPTMNNPLASFISRPGGMPQPGASGVKMDRTPSSTSLTHPNSPRNASQRGGSRGGSRAAGRREDPKDNKAMPLTAGANFKPIEVSATGWKPRSVGANAPGMVGPAPGGESHMAPDVVQRKVKSNLNKMTPNNFDKITVQILEISAQSKDENDGRTLRQVIQLTFEKATDEAHWAEMYAQFCQRMLESMSPEIKDENIRDKKGEVVHGGALFRKYLLNRCQEEFERGWKINIGDKPEGETEESAMLSDQYYIEAAAKRRGLGLVRFIGELYKLGMLTERIMHECVKKLVDYEGMPDEAEVESLTNLLKTIGQPLDSTEKGPKMMDAYFMKINEMIAIEGLPSRLKFMLMDIVDLRKARWAGKGGVLKGPTTLDEVRVQAQQAEMEKERARQAESSRRGGGGGGGRPPLGRGDARNFSGGGQYNMMPPPDYHKNTVGMDDLRRLGSKGGSRQVSSQGPTFAPTSMFSGPRGSNTRRPVLVGAQKDDSGASSRTGTPPAQKEKKDKDEKEAASRTNTFSALAGLESQDGPSSPPSTSPPVTKSQPAERRRSKSPKEQGKAGNSDRKSDETS